MNPDDIRRYLYGVIHARSLTLSEVSKAIGRNHAYLQQYLQRGSPRILPEEIRIKLGEYLGVDAQNFSPLRDTKTRLNQFEVLSQNRKDHRIGNSDDSNRGKSDASISDLGQKLDRKSGFSSVPTDHSDHSDHFAMTPTAQSVGGLFRDRVIPPNFLPNPGQINDRVPVRKMRIDAGKSTNLSRHSSENIIEIDGNLYLRVPFLSRKWGGLENDRPHSTIGKNAQTPIIFPITRLDFLSPSEFHHLRMVDIIGDRMSPSVNHGDMVMIDMSTQNFQGDGVYVISGNSQEIIMCRCLEKFGTRKMTVYYDNQAWPAQEISDPSQLNIIGKVVWIGRNIAT